MHGGEARDSRDVFESLLEHERAALLGFLQTLRTPKDPGRDLRTKGIR